MLSFHRSQAIQVKIQKPDSRNLPATRAFVFDVQIGLGRNGVAVDPKSGMLLNLVKVDPMLSGLTQMWASDSWHSLGELLQKSQQYLSGEAKKEGVFLTELRLREKRGFWLTWTEQGLLMGREVLKELDGMLFKISWDRPFFEETIEEQEFSVSSSQALLSEAVFQKNPQIETLEVENLASREKWVFRKV